MTSHEYTDSIDLQIIAVSENMGNDFLETPFEHIAKECGLPLPLIIDRIKMMLENGVMKSVGHQSPDADSDLSDNELKVLTSLKKELSVDEVAENCWSVRAQSIGLTLEEFYAAAQQLSEKKKIGGFKVVV